MPDEKERERGSTPPGIQPVPAPGAATYDASPEAMARLRERSLVLAELSTRLAEALSPEDVASVSVEQAIRALGAHRGVVGLFDESENVVTLVASMELPDEIAREAQRLPLSRGYPITEAVRTGEPVFVESVAEMERRFPSAAALLRPYGVRASVAVPARANGRVRGAIGLGFGSERTFSDEERSFIVAIASQCAQAILRSRLYQAELTARRRAERAAERASRLAAVATALSPVLAPSEVARMVVEQSVAAVGAAHGSCYRLDGRDLVLLHAVGYPAEMQERWRRFPADARVPIADALRLGEVVIVDADATEAARYAAEPDVATALARGTIIGVPLLGDGRAVGALCLTCDGARPCDAEDREFLLALGHQCGQALERARLFDDAIAANRAKAAFLATMSHELRTPLTAVLGYTELVAEEVVGPVTELQRDHLQRARASGEHLLILIEDLLSFARIEAGKEQVRIERFGLASVVEEAVHVVTPLASKKGLALHVDYATSPPELESDRHKFRQILLNLLANAVKYTEQGEVSVTVHADHEARVMVADTGVGIAPEFFEHIFDPFWQVEQGHTRTAGGTGLGLSVARQLARLLGGDVTVASRVGYGSTFTARLPLRFPVGPAAHAGSSDAPPPA